MTDTTAQILAKRTKGTGLTEDIAKKCYDKLGTTVLAIVELKSEKRGDDLSGKEHVDFSITNLEIVSQEAVDHVRGLQRALFMNRKLHSDDETLDIDTRSDLEPTVESVLAARAQFEPHEYVDTADAICDVCGQAAGAGLHQVLNDDEGSDGDPDEQPTEEKPGDEPAEEEQPPAAEQPDPWEYKAPEGASASSIETVKDPFVTT